MSWNRWLLALQKQARPQTRRRPGRSRLALEHLEDRTLFSVRALSAVDPSFLDPTSTTQSLTGNGQTEVAPSHSVSDNGRYTVFASTATNLVAGQVESAAEENVFLFDKTAGTTTLLSHTAGASATAANNASFNAVISGDGSTVLFYSNATDLISGETFAGTNHTALYLYDVGSGGLKLVSHTPTGVAAGGVVTEAANAAKPFVPRAPAGAGPYVNTLAYSTGILGIGEGLALPSVSTNGRYVAYISDASDLAAANTGNGVKTNVYLYDRASDTNTLVSHNATSSLTAANGYASTAAISGDGGTVAFTDPALDLVPNLTTPVQNHGGDELYVWSRIDNPTTGMTAGQLRLASHAAGAGSTLAAIPTTIAPIFGFTGDAPPALSNDGSAVAYYFAGSNVVTGQAGIPSVLNVFRYDVLHNTNDLVTHTAVSTTTAGDNPTNQIASGGIGPAEATGPSISADGRFIAFANNSSNLLATPLTGQNGQDNVYLYDATTQANTLVSHAAGSPTTADPNGGTAPSISADGRYVAFIDLAYPATSPYTWGNTTTTAYVRIFDRLAADPTAQPATVGGAIDPNTPLTTASAILAPTVISADGSTIVWDGSASTVVPRDNNNNLDTFQWTNDTTENPTPPTIVSTDHTTFIVGTTGSFQLTTTGYPTPTYSESGTLPDGLTFNSQTGQLTGTPGPGTGGVYTLTFTATNGVGQDATQTFTLTIGEAPAITSTAYTTFTVGTANSFTVTDTGYPVPTLSASGSLPGGVTFDPTTGLLAGTPAAGTGGTYNLVFTAHNGINPDAVQNFMLTIYEASAITSGASTTFTVGTAGSFTVTATGFPAPTLSESGDLPAGVTFDPATGVLGGTPAAGTDGVYNIVFTASNGVGDDAVQTFTLVVNPAAQPPTITSADHTTFVVGAANVFYVTATNSPTSFGELTGALPSGVTFDPATGTLSGAPLPGTGGVYNLVFVAGNDAGTSTPQSFVLTVNEAAAITSADHTTFTVGGAGSFQFTTTGFPGATLTLLGDLPAGLTFDPNTGILSGTPAAGTGGVYTLTVEADNGVGEVATQTFTLMISQPSQGLAFLSDTTTTFVIGAANTFNVLTNGGPGTVLSVTGSLPEGVTFDASTGVLSGVPVTGSQGAYNFYFTAMAPDGEIVTQDFTLVVTTSGPV